LLDTLLQKFKTEKQYTPLLNGRLMKASEKLSSSIEIKFPDFTALPDRVKQKFDALPTKVNFFRMIGYSAGAYIEIIDLTQAIFKNLTISDYHKELLVLLVAFRENCHYEWEQHVSIGKAAGVVEDQFLAIAENRLNDNGVFPTRDQALLHFGNAILETGRVPAIVFKHTLTYFSIEELSDATIVVGFYRMASHYIQTFNIPIDVQENGTWVKG
jgi:alkylhydroperoxidase family enzyme